jgi:hypothetical protein
VSFLREWMNPEIEHWKRGQDQVLDGYVGSQ